jgi:Asp-tRNA(Asn)/Glu-tRNA(Gln) amidotransferase A subunit family amidase
MAKFAYVANIDSNDISAYSIGSNGALRPLPGSPFAARVKPAAVAITRLHAGTITTFGSSAFRKFIPDHDSEMVVRLKQAGLVIFGKTHTPEFGLSTSSESRLFGATHNPWNLEYSAGGSSGGSAAAIASGMVPMAYGNDGGGSIRIPASCCGLFGLKPTRARTPAGSVGWSRSGASTKSTPVALGRKHSMSARDTLTGLTPVQ